MRIVITIIAVLLITKIFYVLLEISARPPGWGAIREYRTTKKGTKNDQRNHRKNCTNIY